jgi:hypothetical protein
VYGGAGRYGFREEDLSGCGIAWNGSGIENVPAACFPEAVEAILDWLGDQSEAARIGSALAGRPLRMAASGVHMNAVINGYDASDPDDPNEYLVTELSDWCNTNRAYYSMHVHYFTVAEAVEAIKKLGAVSPYTSPPWITPMGRISTEVGAKADFDHNWWSDDNNANIEEHQRYFFTGDGDPSDTWEAFVTAWMTDDNPGQWGGNGPEFDTVFGAFDDAGFNAICYGALQYSIGTYGNPSPHLIEALRATKVREDDFFEDENETDRFTPLADDYETYGATYKISSFEPHNDSCNTDHTCPGCIE